MNVPDIVADFGDLNGEAPVWDGRTGCLYWTDCVGLKFSRFDSHTQKSEILWRGLEITGYALNEGGGFVIANSKGIWLWNGGDQLQLIASEVDGALCQMNDAAADPRGRFLAGSYFYNSERDYPRGCLFRVDIDGEIGILDDGIQLANGIAFSPDGTQLYFTDSAARLIYKYDYNVITGEARNRSVLIQVPLDEGVPDGLAVDADGYLWSAQWYGGCVVRYDPDGVVERRILTPAKQTSSVAFGGPGMDELFVTSAAEHFASPLSPPGYDPRSSYLGGSLYRFRVGVQGEPRHKSKLQIR